MGPACPKIREHQCALKKLAGLQVFAHGDSGRESAEGDYLRPWTEARCNGLPFGQALPKGARLHQSCRTVPEASALEFSPQAHPDSLEPDQFLTYALGKRLCNPGSQPPDPNSRLPA